MNNYAYTCPSCGKPHNFSHISTTPIQCGECVSKGYYAQSRELSQKEWFALYQATKRELAQAEKHVARLEQAAGEKRDDMRVGAMLAAGFVYSELCAALDRDCDPRKMELPALIDKVMQLVTRHSSPATES